MAAISSSGPAGPSLTFDDYSLYSNLSDDELLQLAIERSLTDAHCDTTITRPHLTAPDRSSVNPVATKIHQPSHSSHNASAQSTAHYSSPNPPSEEPPDPKTFDGSISRFMTGSGKRMVAYRKADGCLVHIAPEPEEEEELLFKAIRAGEVSRVKALVMRPGTNLMLPSKPGWLATHQAAFFGQDTCLRVLLSAQPGIINKRTDCGESALLVAISKDQPRCLQVLLENGADPDIPNNDKETPLYKAPVHSSVIWRLSIKSRSRPNSVMRDRERPNDSGSTSGFKNPT